MSTILLNAWLVFLKDFWRFVRFKKRSELSVGSGRWLHCCTPPEYHIPS